jgi:hypothetical protein
MDGPSDLFLLGIASEIVYYERHVLVEYFTSSSIHAPWDSYNERPYGMMSWAVFLDRLDGEHRRLLNYTNKPDPSLQS